MKRMNYFCRYIAILIALVFAINVSPVFAEEMETNTETTVQVESGTATQMLTDRINTMVEETGETLTVSAIKELHDFAGNLYYLVEYTPTGYMICHGVYGNILEYSTSAPSPYSGYNDYLLYCGPTYYYYASKENVSHTYYMDEQISLEDTETLEEYESASNTMNMAEAENPSFIVTQTGTVSMNDDITQLVGTTMALEPNATPTGTKTYVGGASAGAKIKNLTTASQIGYYSAGVCGYIASGLLLYWIDECAGSDLFVNDFAFIRSDHNGYIDSSLTRLLRSYGFSNSSDAGGYLDQSIKAIIDLYARKHSLSINTNSALFGSIDDVLSALKKNNLPVIVFGKLYIDEINYEDKHAVFAYGYTSTGQVLVHYGWAGYSEIVLNHKYVSLGSRLELLDYSSPSVVVNDVSSSNWAYNAVQYCARYRIITTSNDNFNPDGVMTRGAFVQALYELVGEPDTSAITMPSNYTDVSPNSPYYSACKWAVNRGILLGDTATTLGINNSLTREQAVTFLHRYSTTMDFYYANTAGPALNSFSDNASVSSYARTAMAWAVQRYLINGDNGLIYPQRILTRAETAQMLYNLVNRATR